MAFWVSAWSSGSAWYRLSIVNCWPKDFITKGLTMLIPDKHKINSFICQRRWQRRRKFIKKTKKKMGEVLHFQRTSCLKWQYPLSHFTASHEPSFQARVISSKSLALLQLLTLLSDPHHVWDHLSFEKMKINTQCLKDILVTFELKHYHWFPRFGKIKKDSMWLSDKARQGHHQLSRKSDENKSFNQTK